MSETHIPLCLDIVNSLLWLCALSSYLVILGLKVKWILQLNFIAQMTIPIVFLMLHFVSRERDGEKIALGRLCMGVTGENTTEPPGRGESLQTRAESPLLLSSAGQVQGHTRSPAHSPSGFNSKSSSFFCFLLLATSSQTRKGFPCLSKGEMSLRANTSPRYSHPDSVAFAFDL